MVILALVTGCVFLQSAGAGAQGVLPVTAEEDVPAGDPTGVESANADDLDSLLELADRDVTQLARVNVAAPALQVEVSSVSRQKSTVGKSPAAVFVITNEMIRRSGARSIPEVLRMAPGVDVARIDASKWAISIRGFNGRFANKLLVQIDGRTVYTPMFGGVFWDVQDLLLEDVERIEVVRGPGATVWGANAVNGVINVITKKAIDTQGAFVEGGAGTEERGFVSARYGGQTGDDLSYRFYGKWFDRDRAFAFGDAARDGWAMGRGGFRVDWEPNGCDTLTFQGDYYDGGMANRSLYPDPTAPLRFRMADENERVVGGNALLRWTRVLSDDSDWSVQLYYDRTEREFQVGGFGEDRDTFDVDFQHRLPLGWCHSIIWGAGYRNTRDQIRNSPFVLGFNPTRRADDLFSYFVQDEIALREDLWYLTVGSKFSHSDYTPFEYQPTARLLWTPDERHSIWASISRAVRSPTRADDDVRIVLMENPMNPGAFPLVLGNRGSVAEDLLAYEAGIRVQPTDRFSWDLATFYMQYEDLRVTVPGARFFDPGPPPASFDPLMITNGVGGYTYGFELAANFEIAPCWRVSGAYTFFREEMDVLSDEGTSPGNQVYLQSSWDLGRNWELDVAWRYVDVLSGQYLDVRTGQLVPSYNVMDVRLAWYATPTMELAVVGRHLLDSHHPEFGADTYIGSLPTEVQQEVYGMVTWRY